MANVIVESKGNVNDLQNMQIELLGMQVAYTAAIIGAPIFILGLVILILGNKKFKSEQI